MQFTGFPITLQACLWKWLGRPAGHSQPISALTTLLMLTRICPAQFNIYNTHDVISANLIDVWPAGPCRTHSCTV